MFDQIVDSAVDTAEDKSVWFSAAGAAAGGALAVQQRFSMLSAVATIRPLPRSFRLFSYEPEVLVKLFLL